MITVLEFEQRIHKGETVDWVKYGPKDDITSTQTWSRVKDLEPPEEFARDGMGIKEQHMTYIWAQLEPAYNAWKEGVELPEFGTPLAAWPGVNKAQVKGLQAAGVKTIEDLRDLSETAIPKIRVPGLRALVTQAALYLDGKDKADLVRSVDEQNQRIAALEAQLEATAKQPEKKKQAKAA